MNSTLLFSILVVLFGAFTQTLTGFGMGLVAMSLLPSLLGLHVATPLVALASPILEMTILFRYRQSLEVRSIWKLLAASLVSIPLGVLFLRQLDERIALFVLGLVITGYALYALTGFRLPDLRHPFWAFLTGSVAGMLAGAYNTSGPPVVIYGNSRRWSPQEFKSNLSGFFVANSLIVVSTHFLGGHYTPAVMSVFWWILPAMAVGFFAGQSLDRWLNPELFRKVVLAMLIILGIRLMIG